ncbi:hypothetical protein D0N36_18205 [Hymenobacter lapidiphilus]|uniref:hypothetical protein n=1 Tax=Hymenobacter sp. CCM 8763 TaxID=2303334 RepID=UPI000E356E7E|nr:hypothetical protein [Hymenobacter sp. CCM 8763]RFP63686.1 hypothetical protein D0N36_18205 [Hymenobacter sp. CCM 8763]
MQTLRSRLALVLLLCFTRVLLPEAWILSLHQHQHTTEEPSQVSGNLHGKTVLSAPHQHCDIDSFYHIPFQPGSPVELPSVFTTYLAAASVAPAPNWLSVPAPAADSRGPPRRS